MKDNWKSIKKDGFPDKEGRYLCYGKGWFAPDFVWCSFSNEQDEEGKEYTAVWWSKETDGYEAADSPMIKEDGEILPTHYRIINPPKI